MGYQPIEDLLPQSGNSVYKLVRMAARRATELADGQPPLIDKINGEKTTTIALEEIRRGKVQIKELSSEEEKKS